MVEALAHGELGLFALEGHEFRVAELRNGVAPAEALFPHEDAHLVAEVEEALRLRIMAAADEVGSDAAEVVEVEHHQAFRCG